MSFLGCNGSQTRRMFEPNAMAPFRTTCRFLPTMVEKHHGYVGIMADMASFITIGLEVEAFK